MPPILPVTPPNNRFWRALHFPLALLGVGLAMLFVAGAVIQPLANLLPARPGTLAACAVALFVAIGFALAYAAFVRFVERRPSVAEFAGKGAAGELAGGLAIGFLLFSASVGIIALLGGYRVIGTNPPHAMLTALALSIFSGVVEEIALRGLFFRIIESWLGSWIALALSATLFGALHLANPDATAFAAVAIALEAGVLLAAVYMVTRRLWAAIGFHAAWNFTQGGIYGIAISGFSSGGLLRPAMTGPGWLTGGAFGAEASLPAVAVCLGAGVFALRLAIRRGRIVAPAWRRQSLAGVQE